MLKIQDDGRPPFGQQRFERSTSCCISYFVSNKTASITKQSWLQFLFVVKATSLVHQISTICPQILSAEASLCIFDKPLSGINVTASVCT